MLLNRASIPLPIISPVVCPAPNSTMHRATISLSVKPIAPLRGGDQTTQQVVSRLGPSLSDLLGPK